MIRKAKEDDLISICELIHENLRKVNSSDYTEHVINFMISHYSPEKVRNLIVSKDNFYVFEDKNTILGCVLLDKCEVKSLFVNTKSHKHGIGKTLMQFIEDLNLCSELSLYASETAYIFYKRLGYKLISPTDDPDFGISYFMTKPTISTL
ncbi:MAG: GNAT family N-acetyltransferase [Acidaminobacteraceae bacterium]